MHAPTLLSAIDQRRYEPKDERETKYSFQAYAQALPYFYEKPALVLICIPL